MGTARLAIGAVSVLALGALAIGSAPYWMHKGAAAGTATPWGAIASLDVNRAEAAQPDERAKLLELATLKSGLPAETPPSAPPAAPIEPAPVAQAEAAPVPAAVPTMSQPDVPTVQPGAVPQQVASVEVPATAAVDEAEKADASDRININTASSNALDRLPGAGRIGHTIVSHRPYKTVKELVSRRILRLSDFQKIQSHIGVD